MPPLPRVTPKRAAVAGVVLAVLLLGYFEVRWLVFTGRLNNCLLELGPKPDARTLVALKPKVLAQARSLWIGGVEVDVRLEQHSSNGLAMKEDMTKCWWFVVVEAKQGSRFV